MRLHSEAVGKKAARANSYIRPIYPSVRNTNRQFWRVVIVECVDCASVDVARVAGVLEPDRLYFPCVTRWLWLVHWMQVFELAQRLPRSCVSPDQVGGFAGCAAGIQR